MVRPTSSSSTVVVFLNTCRELQEIFPKNAKILYADWSAMEQARTKRHTVQPN